MKGIVVAGCCVATLLIVGARGTDAEDSRVSTRSARQEALVRIAPNELIEVNVALSPSGDPSRPHAECRVQFEVAFSDPRAPSVPPLQVQSVELPSTAGGSLATFAFDPEAAGGRGDAAAYLVSERHHIVRGAGKDCTASSDLSLVNKDTGEVRAGKRLTKAQIIAEVDASPL